MVWSNQDCLSGTANLVFCVSRCTRRHSEDGLTMFDDVLTIRWSDGKAEGGEETCLAIRKNTKTLLSCIQVYQYTFTVLLSLMNLRQGGWQRGKHSSVRLYVVVPLKSSDKETTTQRRQHGTELFATFDHSEQSFLKPAQLNKKTQDIRRSKVRIQQRRRLARQPLRLTEHHRPTFGRLTAEASVWDGWLFGTQNATRQGPQQPEAQSRANHSLETTPHQPVSHYFS
ncbi:hypothetical protein BaRGS_00037034 [Batillaria attramentaria]|uniref:Uncharacterized protein n=1 Tax=Batillaria attramentaria TaxID=370345 RepID=A0ABD0JAH1_9CAEN